MVNDLLDLAKLEAGRITISPEWFEMVDLFSALRGMFKPIVATTLGCRSSSRKPEAVPRIYTDDKKLSQILRNLSPNALKFTSEGEVRVAATTHRRRPRPAAEVEFSVSDPGIGIATEHLSNPVRGFRADRYAPASAPPARYRPRPVAGAQICRPARGISGGSKY